jgi:hypothetical protein
MSAQLNLPALPVSDPGPHPGELYVHSRKGYTIEVMAIARKPDPGWVVGRYPVPYAVTLAPGAEHSAERRVLTLVEFREEFERIGGAS